MKRSYSRLLHRAQDILAEHNAQAHGIHVITFERFQGNLSRLDCRTVASLRRLSVVELQTKFGITSLKTAKAIVRAFRGPRREKLSTLFQAQQYGAGELKKFSLEELFRVYRPHCPQQSVVEEILVRLAPMRASCCIVMRNNSELDIPACLQVAEALMSGKQRDRMQVRINGEYRPTYRVGQIPDLITYEHPLYPGELLHTDLTDKHGINWSKVRDGALKFLRLGLELEAFGPLNLEGIRYLHELASGRDGLKRLRFTYPAVSVRFNDDRRVERLPVLRTCRNRERFSHLQVTGSGDVSGRLLRPTR